METTGTKSIAIPHLVEMVTASTRLIGALSDLTDDDMRAPSLLAGWTRGHVLTHLARNADAFCNLLHWAETGQEHYMCESQEQRNADIEAGATRSAHDLRVDVSASAGRLIQAINELDVAHEERLVARAPGTPGFPAKEIATHRLVELEVHHADLDLGYGRDRWSDGFCRLLLDKVQADRAGGPSMVLRATDTGGHWKYGAPGDGPTIEGRACDLAWWVMGRGDGTELSTDAHVLPELGRWR